MADPLLGTTVAERYRIDELIGEGLMARVYVAQQLSMGRRIALKVLRPELSEDREATVRFRREVEAVAKLQSPHTIEFYDFGATADGQLYIAMELLGGETLRGRLDRGGAIPPGEVVRIVRQVADALGEAHAAGIVHRDLKPENIHFSTKKSPIQPFVKVLDFGLAKLRDSANDGAITARNTTVGTPAYLAPEVAKLNGVADWRSDLYALGVITFEMLAGERPYDDVNPMQVMLKHVNQPVPSIYASNPMLPSGLDGFMAIALAKDPGERMVDAEAFATTLELTLRE